MNKRSVRCALGLLVLAIIFIFTSTQSALADGGSEYFGYTHLIGDEVGPYLVSVGDSVSEGQEIGQVCDVTQYASCGYGNASHLHWMKTYRDVFSPLAWDFADPRGSGDPISGFNHPGAIGFGAANSFDYEDKHTGVDYLAPHGTPVLAVCDGTVVWVGDWPFEGAGSWMNTIWIRCGSDGGESNEPQPEPEEPPSDDGGQSGGGQNPPETPAEGDPDWLETLRNVSKTIGSLTESTDAINGFLKDYPWVPVPKKVSDVAKTLEDLQKVKDIIDPVIKWLDENSWAVDAIDWVVKAVDKINKSQPLVVIPTPDPTPSPAPPTAPAPVASYSFSVSAQSADARYQHNIVAFFAAYGNQYQLPEVTFDLAESRDFSGSWTIQPGCHSLEENFGWAQYEDGQGMVVAPGPKGDDDGNGVCNAASMLRFVLAENGLSVVPENKERHPAVAGVPEAYWTYIYAPGMDMEICNELGYPVRVDWSVKGDPLTLSVTKLVPVSTPPAETLASNSETQSNNWIVTVLIIIVILSGTALLVGIFWSTVVVKVFGWLIGLADSAPLRRRLQKRASQEARWIVFISVMWTIFANSELRSIWSYKTVFWMEGSTTFQNWLLVILGFIVIVGWILRISVYTSHFVEIPHRPGLFVEKPAKGCFTQVWATMLGVVLIMVAFYLLSHHVIATQGNAPAPTPTVEPAPPPYNGGSNDGGGGEYTPPNDPGDGCSLSTEVSPNVRRWCELIERYSSQNSLDPALTAAVIKLESGGDPEIMSGCDAVGLMQIMPSDMTTKVLRCAPRGFPGRPTIAELKNPETNIAWGTQYLSSRIAYWGNVRDALMHYGPANVGYYYADKVLALYQRYK